MMQADMACFVLMIWAYMWFFMSTVFGGMIYNKLYPGMALYLSHQKDNAESLAFVLSTLALSIMGYPSMYLLYKSSNYSSVELMVKVIGSQWYWSWEISNLQEDAVPSYMLQLDDLGVGEYRLLEVDNVLTVPAGTFIQFNVTSSDVIHSFALPGLALKVDAMPGILSAVVLNSGKVGTHYGQCSEMCGMNHAFMPIVVEIVPITAFIQWAKGLL